MEELIKALQLLATYAKPNYPLQCEHDKLSVMVDPITVSSDDKRLLEVMGFYADNDNDCFYSYRYGSC